jgi:cytochrome c oxidase subunit 2
MPPVDGRDRGRSETVAAIAAPSRAACARVAASCAALAACSGPQSVLDAASPQARVLATLTWWMFGIASAVLLLVVALVAVAIAIGWRGERDRRLRPSGQRAMVALGGVLLPAAAAVALMVGSAVAGRGSPAAAPPEGAMTVEVTGHRWWWEAHYLDEGGRRIATVANELHVPVGRPVKVLLKSADVIHSFWAPNLQGKADMVPGRTNVSWFVADREGTFRGQCAEFCGEQHAKMAFLVVVEPAARFDEWLERQAMPADAPTDPLARRGLEVFESAGCAACHAVRGTAAAGRLGPDLTHLAARATLAAGSLPNGRGALAAWILDPPGVKPGTTMPPTPLVPEDLDALLHWLAGLH